MQLHDVTGEVQPARLIIAAQRREVRVAVQSARCASCRAGDAHFKFKIRIDLENKKSKPRFRVNMISRGRGERPPALGHRIIIPLVRGMG